MWQVGNGISWSDSGGGVNVTFVGPDQTPYATNPDAPVGTDADVFESAPVGAEIVKINANGVLERPDGTTLQSLPDCHAAVHPCWMDGQDGECQDLFDRHVAGVKWGTAFGASEAGSRLGHLIAGPVGGLIGAAVGGVVGGSVQVLKALF